LGVPAPPPPPTLLLPLAPMSPSERRGTPIRGVGVLEDEPGAGPVRGGELTAERVSSGRGCESLPTSSSTGASGNTVGGGGGGAAATARAADAVSTMLRGVLRGDADGGSGGIPAPPATASVRGVRGETTARNAVGVKPPPPAPGPCVRGDESAPESKNSPWRPEPAPPGAVEPPAWLLLSWLLPLPLRGGAGKPPPPPSGDAARRGDGCKRTPSGNDACVCSCACCCCCTGCCCCLWLASGGGALDSLTSIASPPSSCEQDTTVGRATTAGVAGLAERWAGAAELHAGAPSDAGAKLVKAGSADGRWSGPGVLDVGCWGDPAAAAAVAVSTEEDACGGGSAGSREAATLCALAPEASLSTLPWRCRG
jgi:hypothetical protein